MEHVLITGTGLIGAALAEKLKATGFEIRFLSTSRDEFNGFPCYRWNVNKGWIQEKAFDSVSHIIHLAGAGIADKRWTPNRKKEIIDSRVESAHLILKELQQSNHSIDSFVSASGIGYYGAAISDHIHLENENPSEDFIGHVCDLWEKAADQFTEINARVVKIRTGIVLSSKGGAFPKLVNPIKLCLGAKIATGNQFMPWIHIDDLCQFYQFALGNKNLKGVFNAVAPSHTTNKVFTQVAANQLNRPLLLPGIPKFALRLFLGEMAVLLYTGSRVSSEKIIDVGFQFKYATIKDAIVSLVKEKKQ